MKHSILVLLVLLSVSQVAESQLLIKKPPKKTQPCAEKPSKPRSATSASYKDGVLCVGNLSYRMIPVKAGTFTMGSTPEQEDSFDDEKPTHRVILTNDYYMGETEVTQALWQAVMGYNPSKWKGYNLPVEWVTWNDCQKFISRLNTLTGRHFRLPTEAEWEYAARGGCRSRGYHYAGSDYLADVAWYDDNSDTKTHPVKGKDPNELGLYDLSGNVYEWCQDWYDDYSSASQTDPTGPTNASYRVIRGGSWRNVARICRVAYRYYFKPDDRDINLGFRLVLSE